MTVLTWIAAVAMLAMSATAGRCADKAVSRVMPCSANPAALCVSFSADAPGREFPLTSNPAARVLAVGTMGDQFPGSEPAAFVYWETGENPSGSSGALVRLSVFDANGPGLRAWVSPPDADPQRRFEGYSVNDTYFGVIDGPDGKRYPFLAPGARYLNVPHWDYLCRFDPTAISQPDPSCGTGFRRYSATFDGAEKLAGFRHNGGWLEDVDGDGWSDVNLPFLRYILVISGRTGQQLALLHPDFTRQSEPAAPDDFDSGRMYASYTPFIARDGKHDVLIAAGNVVGTFDDVYCNVSRYDAVLETAIADDPASRHLKWSDYISFVKNFFQNAPSHSDQPNPVLRRGDLIDKCTHRISTSVFHADTRLVTLYDEFTADPPISPDTCLSEQWLEWRDRFPPEEMKAWTDCAKAALLPATGRWTVHVLELDHGRETAAWRDAYIWGRVFDFVPFQHETFVLEILQPKLRFDRSGYRPLRLSAVGLDKDFKWHDYGTLPGAVPPALIASDPDGIMPYEGSVGASNRGIREIRTRRRADGLQDIQLDDGSWIGYSVDRHQFVIEP